MTDHERVDEELNQLTAALQRREFSGLPRYLTLQQGKLLAFIERRLGAPLRRKVEPDDIWQETSVEALRSIGEVDLTTRDPLAWLFQVAERKIIDQHRKFFGSQKRDAEREVSLFGGAKSGGDDAPADLIHLLVASFTTASQQFSRNHREVKLMHALAALPEIQQEALKLRYLEGLPSKDVAERLGKTDGAVRVMLTRALAKLQEILVTEPEA